MTQYPWQTLLQADLNQLKNALPEYKEKGGSLIYWMLKKNHIEFNNYLSWAQGHYGMAYLQSQFFEKAKNAKIWHKYIHTYKWTKECVPVGEWEDTLLVACIEPPQDIPHFPKIIPVIAHPTDIESMWHHYNTENIFSFENYEEPPESSIGSQTEENSTENEMPAGWGDEPATRIVPSFKNGSVIPEAPTIIRPSSPLKAKPINSEPALDEENEPTVIRPHLKSSPAAAAPHNAPLIEENEPTLIRPQTQLVPQKMTPVIIEENEPTMIRPSKAESVGSSVISALDLDEIESSAEQVINHEGIHAFFSKLENHYEKSALFLLKDNQFLAYSWTQNMKPHKTKIKDSIQVESPSIFRIIYNTQKSYHGHIVLNDANEEFFENWNQGQIPEFVTATPLTDGDKTFGFLISFADNNVNKKASLLQHEKIADQITSSLFQLGSQKAAS